MESLGTSLRSAELSACFACNQLANTLQPLLLQQLFCLLVQKEVILYFKYSFMVVAHVNLLGFYFSMRDNTQSLAKFYLSPLLLSFSLSWGLRRVGRPENSSASVSCSKWARSRLLQGCTAMAVSSVSMEKGSSFVAVQCLFFKCFPLYLSNDSWTMTH